MQRQTVGYPLSQGSFREPGQVQRQADWSGLSTIGVEMRETLDQCHSLSVDVSSLEEVNVISAQLFAVCVPITSSCTCSHSCVSRSQVYEGSYWLCCWYERLSLDLLKVLGPLRVRFTLHNTVTHQDALRFWPGYASSQGTLVWLLDKREITTVNEPIGG